MFNWSMYLINVLVLFSWLCTLALFGAASPDTGKQMATQVSSFSAQTGQSPSQTPQPPPPASSRKDEETVGAEALEAQRRTFAASIIMSLADEARSYKD